MVNDNITPNNDPNDRLAQLLLDEIPAPAADYWTRIDQTLRSAQTDVAAAAVRDIGTQSPKKTAATLITWRTTPLLIAATAILIAGLVIVFRNNNETAVDTFHDPDPTFPQSLAAEALDRIPIVCDGAGLGSVGRVNVDFVDNARRAKWWDASSPYSRQHRDQLSSAGMSASISLLGLHRGEDEALSGFGFSYHQSEVAIMTSCPPSPTPANGEGRGVQLLAALGSFDVSAVEQVTADDPTWGQYRYIAESAGLSYYAYEDAAPPDRGRTDPAASLRLNHGGQLFVDDSIAIRVDSRDDVLGPALRAVGSSEELAARQLHIETANFLHANRYLGATISSAGAGGSVPNGTAPTTLLVTGIRDAGDHPVYAITYVHASAIDASANAEVVKQSPYLESLGDSYQIDLEGPYLTITFDADRRDDSPEFYRDWQLDHTQRQSAQSARPALLDPDSAIAASLEALPAPCHSENLTIDFLHEARQASWWPEPTEFPSAAEAIRRGVVMQASDAAFNFFNIRNVRYRDQFGYDVDDADVVIATSCESADQAGELRDITLPLYLAIGSFDTEAVDEATENDAVFGELRYTATSGDRSYYAYKDPGESPEVGVGIRVNGYGGQLYVDDGLAIRMEGAYDSLGPLFATEATPNQERSRLALRTQVEALREIGYISVDLRYIGDFGLAYVPDGVAAASHVAVGVIDDGGPPKVGVTFIHDTNERAQRNAESFEASDYLAGIGIPYRVETNGTYVTVIAEITGQWSTHTLYSYWRTAYVPPAD